MEFVLLKKEGDVSNITINKEKSLNALSTVVLKELFEVLSDSEVKKSKVVTLTGAGKKAFVAGADISEMKDFNSIQAKEFSSLGHKVFRKLEDLKGVSISLVDGFALGGGFELALATDIILATSSSKFGLPETGLGLIPGFGGTQRLSRSLGVHYANALTLTGDMISAKLLREKGLVYQVTETKEELFKASEKIIGKILNKGSHATGTAKRVIRQGASLSFKDSLNLEQQEFALLFGTKESSEGVAAFLEGRKPKF